ncbi:GNAT family N-acetyltransferase [Paenibacillus lignilyticus]|uniref:GNAT family N-acetyltransferase n=1 Tax=Paenibacillus lignilyticus TaxID=1172615 RepID=A0ABS5C6N9_9BACL|nr:GNAT family protein [Paenibacillus lignilyticus]MBP3961664.1 GNAT family N-acetyltransferase [Paenibacillus lignilyticus]MBP3963666.1 GNAT family N-acetyltransferase [Paenibacillus lignilyticus]
MFPTLETERLILRELTEEDAADIFACFSNADVTRYYGQETLERLEQAAAFVELFARNYEEKRGIRWGIQLKDSPDNRIMGTIGFNAWMPKHRRAEIGYELHPDHWHRGYATEAVSRIVAYGFDQLELARIGAVVFRENQASQTVLTKLGFQQEGILRDYIVQDGKSYDTHVYSILRYSSK